MPDLGDVIGTFLGSLAHARRIADEESAAIAEYYRSNPLLEGMSLPRVRVPEMVLEIPVLIENFDEGTASVAESATTIKTELGKQLKASADALGLTLPTNFRKEFEAAVAAEVKTLDAKPLPSKRGQPREAVARAAEATLARLAGGSGTAVFPAAKMRELASQVRQKAIEIAIRDPGQPSSVKATVLTAEVKERADAANVTRLRIVLKEEGLEWSAIQNDDGTVTRKLTPE